MTRKSHPESDRPNIVVILADDMGYSDIGCYGSEIETPNLDRLARGGVRFSQMYNNARCCPTRASLLTGLYPHQAGVGHMTSDLGIPAYQGCLRDDCVTIAEALGRAGYRTGMSGKWHVGGNYGMIGRDRWSPGDARHPVPWERGFERHFGTLDGAGSYFNPHTLYRDGEPVEIGGDEDFYYTDEISSHAVDMIEEFHATDDPFFLYVAYTAPHWPLHALPEDIEKYRGRYRCGWDAVREARHRRLIDEGLIDPSWALSPRDAGSRPWEEVPDPEWEDMRMAVYAAQVDRMDQGIGRILDSLRRLELEENTLVLFLSDNGGCAELLAESGWIMDYVPPTRRGEAVVPGNDPGRMPGGEDTYMSYELPWANASNAPFRLFKHWVHEGGISTPLIVSWPRGMAGGGRLLHTPCHVIDIMATCLDAAGASYPDTFDGHAITPLEGESLLDLLRGDRTSRLRPIVLEHEGNRAVRSEDWKLVCKHPGDWELYDMARDRTELHDLAAEHPDQVRELAEIYREWAERCGVVDWDALLRQSTGMSPSDLPGADG